MKDPFREADKEIAEGRTRPLSAVLDDIDRGQVRKFFDAFWRERYGIITLVYGIVALVLYGLWVAGAL